MTIARFVSALLLALLSFSAGATPLADKLEPGKPYYYDSFDSGKRPWNPGQDLNIEEVFKNYQYYEIVLDQDGKGITVNQYTRGVKSVSEKYEMLPDGSLQKK
jgi:hypothetical protein